MIEKIQFTDLASLQERARSTLGKIHQSSNLGLESLRVITDDIKQQLDEADVLGATAQAVDNAVDPTRGELQSGYRVCNELIVDREIEDITERAKDLALKAPLLDDKTLAKKVIEVRSLIFHLTENETLSKENREYIQFAQKLLDGAQEKGKIENASLSGRTISPETEDTVVTIDFASHVVSNIDPDTAIEICHIAHCLYDMKLEKARALTTKLTPFHQSRIEFFMNTLGVSLSDINENDQTDEQIEVLLTVVRAYVAAANELSGNNFIPEEDEVVNMFEEFELP